MVKNNTSCLLRNFSGMPGTKPKVVLRTDVDIFCQYPAAGGTELRLEPLVEFSGSGANRSVVQDAGTVSSQEQPKGNNTST